MTCAEFDLSKTPVAAGQALYLAVQVNIILNKTGVSLLIDGGTPAAGFHSSSNSDSRVGWHLFSYQLTMGTEGMGRVGIEVFSSDPQAGEAAAVVEIGAVVVAPIGQEWSKLAGKW